MVSTLDMEQIHVRLREQIDGCGLSLAEASRMAGEKDPQRLRDVVGGRQKCPIDLLARLSELGIDVPYILTGVPQAAREELDRVRRARDVVMEALVLWSGVAPSALAEIHKEALELGLSVSEVLSLLNQTLPRDMPYPLNRRQTQTQHSGPPLTADESALLDAYRRCSDKDKRAMEQVAKALAKGDDR